MKIIPRPLRRKAQARNTKRMPNSSSLRKKIRQKIYSKIFQCRVPSFVLKILSVNIRKKLKGSHKASMQNQFLNLTTIYPTNKLFIFRSGSKFILAKITETRLNNFKGKEVINSGNSSDFSQDKRIQKIDFESHLTRTPKVVAYYSDK